MEHFCDESVPQFPDTNVCDLGFFRTLQSQQWKLPATKNVDDLIECVQQAFEELAPESIDANFSHSTELSG
jgi:hypothetical protein